MPWHIEHKALRRYRKPKYPVKVEFARNPHALYLHQPAGWLTQPAIAAALSCFLAAGAIRGADEQDGRTPGFVAKVFEHGPGTVTVGCDCVAPAAFLTEEEASKILLAELAKHGVHAVALGEKASTIQLPEGKKPPEEGDAGEANEEKKKEKEKEEEEKKEGEAPVYFEEAVDFEDPNLGVAVEFVSPEDYQTLRERMHPEWIRHSTVDQERYLAISQDIAGKAVSKNLRALGVFYPPLTQSPEAETAEFAKQVEDFVTWLKDEGMID